MQAIEEKIFYFEGSKKRLLLGFLHKPASRAIRGGIIFCHPFADEQNLSQRVIVETARALTKAGYYVFRFDMSGCGDSEGELSDVVIPDWRDDLEKAISIFKNETKLEYCALWGLRLGAGLALLHAGQNKDISSLILWQPVINFKDYIQQFLRRKFTTQIKEIDNTKFSASALIKKIYDHGMVNIIGYPITRNFFESFMDAGKLLLHIEPSCPTLILTISLMDSSPIPIKRYSDNLRSHQKQLTLNHVKVEPFWDRYWRWECPEVSNATLKWMDSIL